MELLPVLFGVACCLTFAFARGGSRTFMAFLLTESWAISNIGWQWNLLVMFQPVDFGVALVGYTIWRETGARWVGYFSCIAVSQLALHAIYDIAGPSFQVPYLFLLDATFAAELLVVAWRGLVDCGINLVRLSRALLRRDSSVPAQKAVKL